MVRNQLANSSLELDRPHHANLEAEIAQRATQIVLDVEGLGLQKLPTGQQHAPLLAGQRLHMHRSVQANTHHLCNAARIIAVALVDLCRQRRLHMPGLNTEDRKSTRLNSSHTVISYAVFCLKKKKIKVIQNERHQE